MKNADPEYLIMPRMEVQLKDWRNDGEGIAGTVTMEYIDVKHISFQPRLTTWKQNMQSVV